MLYVTLLNIIVNKPLEMFDFESLKQLKLRLIGQVKLPGCHLTSYIPYLYHHHWKRDKYYFKTNKSTDGYLGSNQNKCKIFSFPFLI